jgi:hypothetical protein
MTIACKDETCVAYKQCTRFTTNIEKNQPRFALSPREGNSCVFYEGNNPKETRKDLKLIIS